MERVEDSTAHPKAFEVAAHYLQDARDLAIRYRTVEREDRRYMILKSSRFKCFIDLRVALECVLKGYATLNLHQSKSGKELVKKIGGYSHKVPTLYGASKDLVPEELREEVARYSRQIDKLPMSLRYQLDSFYFLSAENDLYYETVGSDSWLNSLAVLVESLIEDLRSKIPPGKVVGSAEVMKELEEGIYNPYRPGEREP